MFLFGSLKSTFLYQRHYNIGVKVLCGHQHTYNELCARCLPYFNITEIPSALKYVMLGNFYEVLCTPDQSFCFNLDFSHSLDLTKLFHRCVAMIMISHFIGKFSSHAFLSWMFNI